MSTVIKDKEPIKSSHVEKCEKCNYTCNAKHFQQNFENWTSGNNDINEFIQHTQLMAHKDNEISNALEWIPYNRLDDITKNKLGKVYKANWIDGKISCWDDKNQNWTREGHNMLIYLKNLNNLKNITIELTNEINKPNGITRDSETKHYMMVLDSNKCEKCNCACYAIHFQQNFENWTSGNDDIDKFIQDTQLFSAKDVNEVLEWIPYDRLHITKDRVNWIDGNISYWDDKNQCWKREGCNMLVYLKNLNDPKNITEFNDEIRKPYGITQDPETKHYMMVLDSNKCKKCNYACYAIHFQQNFKNWTSGDDDSDKFIQDAQLFSANDVNKALEWIPYDRLHITKDEFGKVHKVNWIDGNISYWDDKNQNWKREGHNRLVNLKRVNDLKNIAEEFENEINQPYGITRDPETKHYMMVLDSNKCKKCNCACYAIHFQQNFKNWTSGNDDIDKFIQDAQLLSVRDVNEALEWIPYERLHITKDEFGKAYRVIWIDGNINNWDDKNQNWERKGHNMFVNLKSLNNSGNLTLEFTNKIKMEYRIYGITRDPETTSYMMVLNNICEKCNDICNTIHFQQKFLDWTSGNNNVDKFIQDTQLLAHDDDDIKNVLEWIPYDRFYNIEYIAKGGFGKIYKANWIDGYMSNWNIKDQNWKRYNQNMIIALKSLDNSKNVTLEFMNEIASHNKGGINTNYIAEFYGVTQDPETKNYMMVLNYAENGSLRNYLDKEYSKLNWSKKIDYLRDIILGLKCIHEKELIHRDLHIGNILKFKYKTAIADMGLCKPANYNELENAKNNIYGVLPYIAPEVLRGQNYTKASDIYSFGIIIYEVISGLPPYHNLEHDNNLALKICQGLRPWFNIKVPQLIVSLIKECLDAVPSNRPKAEKINDILYIWQYEPNKEQTVKLRAQIKETDEKNNNSSNSSIISTNSGISYNTHSEAIYTSRLLNFNNLSEPKNSDDYYEQNDNIISKEFSGII
ncbi:Ypk2p [Rhizophagus irregularis DAOM 197198w]|uniref:Ypk2p n=1 Tax=Rhizophagus irregularis (strain DAOM 197198w) TaxID=1432141 RepID=A0A015JTS1_RHIIW|nr:Ypk2p [Rhizophagus irregularis DAOM 197198w]